ncbi:putative YcjX-like family ATPase [Bradyrhizobium sp. LM3.4]
MAFSFQDMVEEARLSARALIDYGEHFFNPTVRLGVTGLSRAGKTVFITALIHGLTRGGRFPVFEAYSSGRIARAHLAPQPDDAVPRFAYESHLRALIEERRWPNSTVDISELRLVIDYQRQNGADRTLTLDIVDYPGEWLLDLPLLHKSFEQWSAESLALSREVPRAHLAADWHAHLATLKPDACEDEQATLTAAKLFRGYLQGCRDERFAMSLLPPGRFLMPGNLADTPALTFAPLDVPAGGQAPEGSLWAMMVRRYEAYKDVVVRPFFRDHFGPARSPDRAGRCARGIQLRPRSAARSRSRTRRHSRLLSHRPQHVPLRPVQAAHRPHPVRGDQGRPSASFQPRPA